MLFTLHTVDVCGYLHAQTAAATKAQFQQTYVYFVLQELDINTVMEKKLYVIYSQDKITIFSGV